LRDDTGVEIGHLKVREWELIDEAAE